MDTKVSKEPDVEFIDVGSVEAKFLTPRAREWAMCHLGKYDAERIINKLESSGLKVLTDPKLSHCEHLRWINTY